MANFFNTRFTPQTMQIATLFTITSSALELFNQPHKASTLIAQMAVEGVTALALGDNSKYRLTGLSANLFGLGMYYAQAVASKDSEAIVATFSIARSLLNLIVIITEMSQDRLPDQVPAAPRPH